MLYRSKNQTKINCIKFTGKLVKNSTHAQYTPKKHGKLALNAWFSHLFSQKGFQVQVVTEYKDNVYYQNIT